MSMPRRGLRLFLVIVATAIVASCNTQSASNLLPEHAREVLSGSESNNTAATPASEPTAPPSPGSESWLGRLNYFRAMAGLDPVADDTKMSAGDVKHARYLVKNYAGNPNPGLDMHLESSKNKW